MLFEVLASPVLTIPIRYYYLSSLWMFLVWILIEYSFFENVKRHVIFWAHSCNICTLLDNGFNKVSFFWGLQFFLWNIWIINMLWFEELMSILSWLTLSEDTLIIGLSNNCKALNRDVSVSSILFCGLVHWKSSLLVKKGKNYWYLLFDETIWKRGGFNNQKVENWCQVRSKAVLWVTSLTKEGVGG